MKIICVISDQSTPSTGAKSATGALDEFYAGALDSSFLDDLTPMSNNQEVAYESDRWVLIMLITHTLITTR